MNAERHGNEINTDILKNYFDFLNLTENFSIEERNIFKLRNKILLYLCTNYSNNSNMHFNSLNNNYMNYLIWGNSAIESENEKLSKYLPTQITENLVCEIKKIIFYDRYSELLDSQFGIYYLLQNFNIQVNIYLMLKFSQANLILLIIFFKLIYSKFIFLVFKAFFRNIQRK